MAKIKARKVSDSSALPDMSPGSVGGRMASGTSSEWDIAAIAVQSLKSKGKAKTVESSRNIFSQAAEPRSGSTINSADKARLESRRPTSAGSSSIEPQVNNEDLNRFVSATTAATATTMSTSFVKHPGPRAFPPGGRMRMIKPDDVLGIVPDKVGKMRYDKASMKWVTDGLDRVDEAGESRASRSRSEGSEDVFAGMDSWDDQQAPAPHIETQPEEAIHDDLSESESSESGDDVIRLQGQVTQIIDADSVSGSESSFSDMEEEPLPPQVPISPPPRASSNLASIPPITTPTPTATAPQPIRSALRNPNTAVATPAALKKRTAWHESVTPAAGAPGTARRSVSFSDGKKAGRIVGLHSEDDINVGVFRRGEDKAGESDATQKRIAAMLGEMGAMSEFRIAPQGLTDELN